MTWAHVTYKQESPLKISPGKTAQEDPCPPYRAAQLSARLPRQH